jgi:hypothetical protein
MYRYHYKFIDILKESYKDKYIQNIENRILSISEKDYEIKEKEFFKIDLPMRDYLFYKNLIKFINEGKDFEEDIFFILDHENLLI